MAEIAGLKLIVPTSVSVTGAGSSGSVSASGKVTFTSAESLTIDGCFVGYDNYLMVIRYVATTGNNTVNGQLRASGVTAGGSDYARQYLSVDSTTVSGARTTGQASFARILYSSATARSGAHIFFYGPSLAQPTAYRTVIVSGLFGGYIEDNAGTHSLSNAYDGIVLTDAAGNAFTGACTFYGLSQ